jgi:hypothetical protein
MRRLALAGSIAVVLVIGFGAYARSVGPVASSLSMVAQESIRGGLYGDDIDCEDVPGPCFTPKPCLQDTDCEVGKEVCTDTTKTQTCTKITYFGLACVVDPPHICSLEQYEKGICDMANHACAVEGDTGQGCGTSATQCHY